MTTSFLFRIAADDRNAMGEFPYFGAPKVLYEKNHSGEYGELKDPSTKRFWKFFRRLPRWVVPLIILLLFGRLLIILLFKLLS
jgi:hypothetical protein